MPETRNIAIDWSGDRSGGKRKIWTAESAHGQLDELANGRTRDDVADYLLRVAEDNPNLVVGFDFAFSVPGWFVKKQGVESAVDFWDVVKEKGEGWLTSCPRPFFGQKGTTRPSDVPLYRRTDSDSPTVKGQAPKSVFQIAGPGHVGTGSIRGMPILSRLAGEGFRIWPFHSPVQGTPLVVEIYPRLLTGPVVKIDREARIGNLELYSNAINPHWREIASRDEDEFDAAISAVVMNRFLHELLSLPEGDAMDQLEGRIWHPLDAAFRPGNRLPNYLDPVLPGEPFVFVFQDGLDDGPFDPALAQMMEWENGADGTVGLPTGGTPRYLRVLKREGDRVFTADGLWIKMVTIDHSRRNS